MLQGKASVCQDYETVGTDTYGGAVEWDRTAAHCVCSVYV